MIKHGKLLPSMGFIVHLSREQFEELEQRKYGQRKVPLPDFPASMDWSKPYSRYETDNGCVISYFQGGMQISRVYDFKEDHYELKEFPVKQKRTIGF